MYGKPRKSGGWSTASLFASKTCFVNDELYYDSLYSVHNYMRPVLGICNGQLRRWTNFSFMYFTLYTELSWMLFNNIWSQLGHSMSWKTFNSTHNWYVTASSTRSMSSQSGVCISTAGFVCAHLLVDNMHIYDPKESIHVEEAHSELVHYSHQRKHTSRWWWTLTSKSVKSGHG